MKPTYPIYLAGQFVTNDKKLEVRNPYNNELSTTTYSATAQQVEEAIQAGLKVQGELAALPTHVRYEALMHIAARLKERKEEFAEAMTRETAKPLFYSRIEVDRAVQTFLDGAEESKRIYGEWMPLDRTVSGEKHEAIVRRFPVGLIAGIAPFNFPLNLVAHKLAPAIAAGCPIILKPASKTPISALLLAELIDEITKHDSVGARHALPQQPASDAVGANGRSPLQLLPPGAISILPMDRSVGDMLVTDERFKLLTFTGSPSVGWDMKARAGKKKVVLELGGNAAVVVTPSGDWKKHLKKIATAAFGQSGQSCIHTQRIFAHDSIKQALTDALVNEAKALTYDDPMKESTLFSSMIDSANAERINSWVVEAVTEGAQIVYGGEMIANTGFMPTILTNTKKEMKVCGLEAFAPIVVVEGYTELSDAVARINDSDFGLQAGVFTKDIGEMMYAYEHLEVGGVVINNTSSFRADHMPYGGVKDSGIGREGVRYAIEDMTERKILVINKDV